MAGRFLADGETSTKRDEYYALYRDRTIDNMSVDQNYAFFDAMQTDQPYYEEAVRTLARSKTFVSRNAASSRLNVRGAPRRD